MDVADAEIVLQIIEWVNASGQEISVGDDRDQLQLSSPSQRLNPWWTQVAPICEVGVYGWKNCLGTSGADELINAMNSYILSHINPEYRDLS